MITWILIAATKTQSHLAQTTISDPQLIYRALSKWLIRGNASQILDSFWEYIDQYDNELEDALLDQLLSQAEIQPDDPQITNVRTKDYSIDMSVHSKTCNQFYKTCKIKFSLNIYIDALKDGMKIEDQTIDITLFRSTGKVEKITVVSSEKTPASDIKTMKRVSKRSSKNSNI